VRAPQDAERSLINRDLSLLAFFERVLEEAEDERNPLLERLKFISILSSNLDEFFMIRVAGLKEKARLGSVSEAAETNALLDEIKRRIERITARQVECYRSLMPRLAGAGIRIRDLSSLNEKERAALDEHFEKCVYPLLTPQTVDPTHPFPYISGGSLNICMIARPRLHKRTARQLRDKEEFFLRIKLPEFIDALLPVAGTQSDFVCTRDVIISNVERLVPSTMSAGCHLFRITRGADIELQESETEDLLVAMEENLKARRFGEIVRLEVSEDMPESMIEYLKCSLEIGDDEVYVTRETIDPGALGQLYKLDRPDLKDEPIRTLKASLNDGKRSVFDTIREEDVLLHHPYVPYSNITELMREAVEDPKVLAIKICLYRIGAESSIAPLLIRASELGKQVTVLIELKARFDEANNIEWAKRFERAGVHVVYGHIGLKTHCKTTLIIRQEGEGLTRYCHVATGNYNPDTSPFYTDLSLLTADEAIGADATELFNYLTAYARRAPLQKLLVAPISLRERMTEMINREAEHARAGRPARIIAKMNRLADADICRALYEASNAGVEIDLIVRGICTLRPGVPGLSENIRVLSVVGRLLEHSRVYYFENGGEPEVYTGSADWMPRNLDRRIEVLAPVENEHIKRYLRDTFLANYLRDNIKARVLLPDGTYVRPERAPGDNDFDSQLSFQDPSNIVPFGPLAEQEATS
jgi:polyphosphate kinase